MRRDIAQISERAFCAYWNDHASTLRLSTIDGRDVQIVHRGHWTHGLGPDFRDAMVVFDGRSFQSGSIELHHVSAGWHDHGHHLDPGYDDVILHVVRSHDGSVTRTAHGKEIPIVSVPVDNADLIPYERETAEWHRVGGRVCAEDLTRNDPDLIRSILRRLGDLRIAAKSARFESRFTEMTPGEALYRELLDGLGFAKNREPMQEVARRLPLEDIETRLRSARSRDRTETALSLLLGVSGFLPFSPAEAGIARLTPEKALEIERIWHDPGNDLRRQTISPNAWNRARVRPGNHPVARLTAAAALIANTPSGIVPGLLALFDPGCDPVDGFRALCIVDGQTPLGRDRATGLIINAVIPFALALSESTGDRDLADRVSAAWEKLPAAESNEIERRALAQVAGNAKLTRLGGRGQQGLIHLESTRCAPRRCFECPIAHAVIDQK